MIDSFEEYRYLLCLNFRLNCMRESYRCMKVELRHLDFTSWDLAAYRGSVCPACPKVTIEHSPILIIFNNAIM